MASNKWVYSKLQLYVYKYFLSPRCPLLLGITATIIPSAEPCAGPSSICMHKHINAIPGQFACMIYIFLIARSLDPYKNIMFNSFIYCVIMQTLLVEEQISPREHATFAIQIRNLPNIHIHIDWNWMCNFKCASFIRIQCFFIFYFLL